ncbi:hypothetical protein EG68_05323 [Paragonimus skrjabini miyazakii]|uniref:Katanin p60 ATPase-containing subunit A-like 2 n=1 Tax=Paragonimus skrjabini miyazakii TaxID=59628 RepID=A0A8S9Z342_9TREM|nr:hypothetical protein EG68_05323 [Paragonimus skrjabini miyazakii]
MAEISYQMIRSTHQAREAEDQRNENRKKNLLLLVMHYLSEEGYTESALSLSKETNLNFRHYEVCDNVDLETVLLEYESYYFVKFHKYPRITKKLPSEARGKQTHVKEESARVKRRTFLPTIPGRQNSIADHPIPQAQPPPLPWKPRLEENGLIKKPGDKSEKLEKLPDVNSFTSLSIEGKHDSFGSGRTSNTNHASFGHTNGRPNYNGDEPCDSTVTSAQTQKRQSFPRQIIDFRAMLNQETRLASEEGRSQTDPQERLLKPLGGYAGYTGEWRELALTISKEIFLQNPDVRWDDIIGLNSAKRLVKEAVVYPIKYPQLFTGILSPWKGLLLYGPPGTGKTLLAKAVATECNTTFFNISASTIVSKWRGDSEKLVRVLFELARFHAPSTIFLDELDSLMSQRGSLTGAGGGGGGGGSEHEGSRRMKTELLMQMDGLAKSDDLVFLLAASNIPWELDHAMLRRLEKRILVDLPNNPARRRMFESFLPPAISSNSPGGLQLSCHIDYELVAELTEGYSGSDIRLVCKEAAMRVVRKIFDILEGHTNEDHPEMYIRLDPVTTEDVKAAISSTKPSASQLSGKYQEWQKCYGSA